MKPSFKDKKGISEKVADYIKEQIRAGVYSVGERIPGERDMSIQLEVSRNTVREAYKILEAYGYLKAEHGRGVFIASEAEQIRKMTESFFISSSQISDLFAVRQVLEESVVEWATKNGTNENVEKLQSIVKDAQEIIASGRDPIELAEYDLQFHLYLAEMSGNDVANRIMHHLIDLLRQARTQSIRIPNRAEKSVAEHDEIVKSIKEGNTVLAKKSMKYHLESVEKSIKDRLS
ncbi:GntR family transcriptional regulator [Lentibacillus populi]|uniref:GntR family transcriptional regulator n=1 Tax=Lentibacillus populi TaxID=1827502 RepID=A0A9W5X7B1_9BACI|nr:FadR/GntR family transcriptional regulator [Lentibacillus populi]GGB54553.1 GntR family transcriptional regulator [Lentibacillus populi]